MSEEVNEVKYKGREITEEILSKAEACKSAEELISLAKENGVELTTEEAEALLEEFEDVELDAGSLDEAAGGDSGNWLPDPKTECIKTAGVRDKNRTDA